MLVFDIGLSDVRKRITIGLTLEINPFWLVLDEAGCFIYRLDHGKLYPLLSCTLCSHYGFKLPVRIPHYSFSVRYLPSGNQPV